MPGGWLFCTRNAVVWSVCITAWTIKVLPHGCTGRIASFSGAAVSCHESGDTCISEFRHCTDQKVFRERHIPGHKQSDFVGRGLQLAHDDIIEVTANELMRAGEYLPRFSIFPPSIRAGTELNWTFFSELFVNMKTKDVSVPDFRLDRSNVASLAYPTDFFQAYSHPFFQIQSPLGGAYTLIRQENLPPMHEYSRILFKKFLNLWMCQK